MHTRNLLKITTILAALTAVAVPSAMFAEVGERPARLEQVAGSEIPRVILLAQAAKRIGIETGEVREVGAKRWKLLIGEVVTLASATGTETAASAPLMQIRVAAEGEWAMNSELELLALSPDATVLLDPGDYDDAYDPFEGDDDANEDAQLDADDVEGAKVVMVVPIGGAAVHHKYKARVVLASTDTQPEALPDNARYFAPVEPDASLMPGQNVFVRVASPGGGDKAKIVPYSSVIYDVSGDSWLYTNPEPLVFVRQKIVIERILGSVVVLSEGPEVGTVVVSVGAAELMGVEQKIGH